jgi:drug/metabolite transporter (DMT)-like permease
LGNHKERFNKKAVDQESKKRVAEIPGIHIIGTKNHRKGRTMKVKVWIALLLVYIIWGATYLAIRVAVETIPPFLMAGTRFLIAGTIFYAWRRAAGDPHPTAGQWLRAGAVGVIMLLGGNGLISLAEKNVASGIAALIVGSAPLWMTTIEAIRPGGIRPNWLGMVGLLLGFGGIVLLVSPSLLQPASTHSQPWGIVIALLAAFFWSVGSVISRHAEMPQSSLMGTAIEMLAGGVGLYLAGTITGEWRQFSLGAVSLRSWIGLIYLTLLGSMVGFSAYAWLLRNAPLPLVSTYAYVNPLVAIFLGNLLAQEILNMQILLAATVIVGSVVLINISRQIGRKKRTIVTVK